MKTWILLLSSFLVFHQYGNSQLIFSQKIIQRNGTERTAILSVINGPANDHIYLKNALTGLNQEIYNGDTIVSQDSIHDYLQYDIGTQYLFTTNIKNAQDFVIQEYIEPISGFAVGEITIQFNNVQNNGSVFPCYEGYNCNSSAFVNTPSNFTIYEIPAGIMVLNYDHIGYISSTIENQYASQIIIYGGDLPGTSSNTLDLNISSIDAGQNCDGSIFITPTNASGDVNYMWGNDTSVVTSFQENLCPGSYYVYAVDASLKHALIQITIADTSNVYSDSSVYNFIASDTAYFNFSDCSFNFSLPIDSIQYSENLLSLPTDSLIVYAFQLIVFQGINTYSFTDTLRIGQDDTIYMSSVIYCEQMKSKYNGKRINLIRKGHQFSNSTSLLENLLNDRILIYPNPTENNITIQGGKAKGVLTDIDGRIVLTFDTNEISMIHLKSGMYFLKIDNTSHLYKIIKK